MSWRELADLTQEVILDTMAERDAADALSVTYEPEDGTPRAIRGIYRERHEERILDPLAAPVSTWVPKLGVKIADLLPDWPVRSGSRFVVSRASGADPLDTDQSTRFAVVDRQLDGEGMVELFLERRD